MKHWIILASLLLGACQAPPPPSLEGVWKFRTTGDYDGYLVGKMTVEDGGCKMTSFQSEFGSAVLACEITWQSDRFLIATEVVSNTRGTWRPESFDLRKEGDELRGTVTKLGTYDVVFKKQS